MSPTTFDIIVYAGATWTRAFSWSSGGEPIDLSDVEIRMQARTSHAAPRTIVELSTTNGRITLADEPGGFVTRLSATETSELRQSGVYDLEVEWADGRVVRLLEGAFDVSPEVTR